MRSLIKALGACVIVVVIGLAAARIVDSGSRSAVVARAGAAEPLTTPDSTSTTTQPMPADPIAELPACVPVADLAGDTVGCALKSELYPAGGVALRTPPSGMPGFPVYDRQGGAIVGYEIPSFGYAPAAMTSDATALAKLTDCMTQLNDGTLDGSPALAGCTAPLQQYGIADPAVEAHKRALSLQQARNALP